VIRGYQVPSGTIRGQAAAKLVANYARASSTEHRENLERQAERFTQYCTIRGYRPVLLVKEGGSDINDSRPKLLPLLRDPLITQVKVVQKNRLTHFDFRFNETL
jgi:predicted site-specific integrase-resolvase